MRLARIICLALFALLGAAAAEAQTPTPWVPGAVTPVVRVKANAAPVTVNLLSSATAVNASAGVYVGELTYKTVQVVVGTCTTYTLLIETSIDAVNYITAQTLTEATVAANATGYATTITTAVRYLRTRLSAASSCTVSTSLHGVP